MAALTACLAPSRTSLLSLAPQVLQPYLSRPTWSIPCDPSSSSSPPVQATPTRPISLLSTAAEALLDLFPPFLLAAPKKKVSHSRKAMRSANKGLENKTNFSHCPACGKIKLTHHICPDCYSQISRRWKADARGEDPYARYQSKTEDKAGDKAKESSATA